MSILTMSELLTRTKAELLELLNALAERLATLPVGTSEYADAIKSLENVRAALARPTLSGKHRGAPAPTP